MRSSMSAADGVCVRACGRVCMRGGAKREEKGCAHAVGSSRHQTRTGAHCVLAKALAGGQAVRAGARRARVLFAPAPVPAVNGRAQKVKVPRERLVGVHAEAAHRVRHVELRKRLLPPPAVARQVHRPPPRLARALPVHRVVDLRHGKGGAQVRRQPRGQRSHQKGGQALHAARARKICRKGAEREVNQAANGGPTAVLRAVGQQRPSAVV